MSDVDDMDISAGGSADAAEPIKMPHLWQSVLVGMAAFTILTVVAWLLIAQYVSTRPYDLLAISDQTATSIENFLVNHNIPTEQISTSSPLLIEAPQAHYYQQDYIVHLPAHMNPEVVENVLERKMRSNDLVVTDYIDGAEHRGLTISYGEFIFANVTFIRLNDTTPLNQTPSPAPSATTTANLPTISLPKVNTAALPAPKPDETHTAETIPPTEDAKSETNRYTGWVPAQRRREDMVKPAPPEAKSPTDDISLARVPTDELTDPDETPTITSPQEDLAKLAIIVDDGGYGGALTDTILGLDNRLTLSILPNTPHGSAIAELAHERGFEVMLHMPMENTDPDLEHPGQLNIDMSESDIIQLTQDALGQIPQAVGVNNHTGSKYTTDPKAMALFMDVIKDLNLYFVDSKTTTETSAYEISKAFGLRAAERDLFLDHDNDEAEIRKRFREVIELAKRDGEAIAICHFRPNTAVVLKDLVPTLEAQGITLVPASELVQ